ncbi:hypothetical protein [Streptomyces olivaceus]|uniref:hypothetical protein n=1 Tax=Streptomyces olivaceus TaxID=47716 RepID=UPI001CCC64D8|nr:hypothetical protein [Streptomyces olivaceus]MBZ6139915.1 hypothetical protein [Streptomyces olivaceus]MBZ6166180.1 hypothetical protein [Streptomyces olivaceus]
MTPQDTSQQTLFTGPSPVTMGERGGPVRPGQALLFSDDEGRLTELQRTPSAFGSLYYRYRYDVDLADHTVGWSEPLQSGTGGYSFQAAFEARWQVEDPVEVVRRGVRFVRDGQEAVCVAMRDLLWPHAARYGIERMEEFAEFVRGSLCSRQHRLPIGLAVDSLTVRIYLEEAAAGHLRALKQRDFDQQLAVAEHSVAMTTHSLGEELQAKRRAALLAAARGEGGMLLEIIAQDPSKLREIMVELGQRHDVAVEQKSRMLRDLIDAGHIQPAEAQQMWSEMHDPPPLFGAGPSALTATPQPALPASSAQGQGAAFAGAVPAGQAAGGATADPAVVAGTVVPTQGAQEPPRPRRRAGSSLAPGAPTPVAAPVSPDPPQPTVTVPSTSSAQPAPVAPSTPATPPEPAAPGDGSANVVGETRVGGGRSRAGRRGPGAGA